MPIKVPNLNATNVLFFVDSSSPWRDRLQTLLLDAGRPNLDAARAHLDLLDRRASGRLDWVTELAPNPARAYNTMLLEGGPLPLYRFGPIRYTVDLHNPGNEAGDATYDPDLVVIELICHRHELYPWDRGVMPDGTPVDHSNPRQYAQQAACGEALGEVTAQWAEILLPHFACADMQYLGTRFAAGLRSSSVANPAPVGTRYWDYLWSLSYWSPALLTDRLALRLKSLSLTPEQRARFDRFWGSGIRPAWRELATGGLMVQYRFIFAENRGVRALVDTPLAKQAGLRTTHLIYRS